MMRPILVVTVLTAAAFAADHPDLNGKWQLSSSPGKLKFETLLIEQNSDSVKITESAVNKKPFDVSCNIDAKECKVKDRKVSFWYNGPALVMMESNGDGDVVTKTRMIPGADGKTLSLEVTRILPAGASATYTFTRQ
ncbi:MAG TPA: hypothetical protein VMB03_25210 [Bryobacteraceae bacterium]|nr:hypothetical protein [Bryobacteraceae bacterium]